MFPGDLDLWGFIKWKLWGRSREQDSLILLLTNECSRLGDDYRRLQGEYEEQGTRLSEVLRDKERAYEKLHSISQQNKCSHYAGVCLHCGAKFAEKEAGK